MSHSHLTKWIEDAEARHVTESAMIGRGPAVSESHFLHLGSAIAKVVSWPHDGVGHELRAIGGQMIERMRHPLAHK